MAKKKTKTLKKGKKLEKTKTLTTFTPNTTRIDPYKNFKF